MHTGTECVESQWLDSEGPQMIFENFQTHMFWASGDMSDLERISTKSFVRYGHQLILWTYGEISNAPPGATIRDAREILPESSFFTISNGSCAPFSDYFRYAVLNKVGGLWVDTDVIALKSWEGSLQPFLVTERGYTPPVKKVIKKIVGRRQSSSINNNVIFNPVPSRGNLIDLAYTYCERFPKDKVRWGELGPTLLGAIERICPDHGFTIKPPEFANPIDFWMCPSALLEPEITLDPGATFLHLYNQTWRDAKIGKSAPFPKRSLMASFAEEYL